MATTILTKNGTSGTPTGLADGELAVDRAAGKLWVGHAGGVTPIVGGALEGGTADGQTLRWEADNSAWEANDFLTITDAGNVGIGTPAPANVLHTFSTNKSCGLFQSDDASDHAFINFRALTTVNDFSVRFGADTNDMVMYTGNAERMRIDASGRVGIGTDAPDNGRLTIGNVAASVGVSAIRVEGDDGNQGLLVRNGAWETDYFDITATRLATGSTIGLILASQKDTRFVTNGVERMRIDSSGNVGIGQTNLRAPLHVDKAPAFDRMLANFGSVIALAGYQQGVVNINGNVNGVNGSASLSLVARTPADNNWVNGLIEYGRENYMGFSVNGVANTTPTEAMRIDASGNVLVGRTTGSPVFANLEVGNSNKTAFTAYRPTTVTTSFLCAFYSDVGGTQNLVAFIEADGDYSPASDLSMKDNIVDTQYGLAETLALRPVEYTFKENETQRTGFIAQEVKGVVPTAVKVTEDGKHYLNAANLVPVLVKAIQELTARLEALEA